MKMLRIVLNPAFRSLSGFFSELTRSGVPAKARKIYDIRNKVYVHKVEGYQLNIKAFKVPGWFQGIVYSTIRRSKARRSYENARRLLQLGFDTPTPVGYIELRRGMRLHQSYYVSIQVDAKDVRAARDTAEGPEIERAVAALMVQMHDAGVFHKDFTDRNVLYNRDKNGQPRLMLIDLNRMSFGVKNRNKLLKNFARIHDDSADETAKLAENYAEISGLDKAQTASKAVSIYNAHRRAKQRNHRLKNIFKR